jgi:hypothetical protein
MHRLIPNSRILAFALILALLTARLGSLGQETFVQPIQDVIFKTAHISADVTKAKTSCFKVKRFVSDGFFTDPPVLADYFPVIIEEVSFLPYVTFPEVYLDIFIPPEGAA